MIIPEKDWGKMREMLEAGIEREKMVRKRAILAKCIPGIRGEWKYADVVCMTVECSVCKAHIQTAYCGQAMTSWKYCPNCGKPMGGREDEID